jgi:chemotaxis methyl-accepting protein methylase
MRRFLTGEEGITSAAVPAVFKQKLEIGEVSLQNQGVDKMDFSENYFDFVACMNVLYQLSEYEQKEALARMHSALKIGGHVLFNDFQFQGTQMFSEVGSRKGWLKLPMAEKIGFSVQILSGKSSNTRVFLLKKEM